MTMLVTKISLKISHWPKEVSISKARDHGTWGSSLGANVIIGGDAASKPDLAVSIRKQRLTDLPPVVA
jgi:hypothetical protein